MSDGSPAPRYISVLVIRRTLLDRMTRQILSKGNRESCGFLSGRILEGCAWAEEAHFATNISESPDQFAIAPKEHSEIVRGLKTRDRSLVAVFHSHLGDPSPSKADIESMTLVPLLWLILGHTAAGDLHRLSLIAAVSCTEGIRQVLVRVER